MTWARRGQSTAEYAVLFAVIVGAAIAVQQYIRFRIQGAVKGATDNYVTAVQSSNSGITVTPWNPDRNVTGSSESDQTMTTATQGATESLSKGTTTQAVN